MRISTIAYLSILAVCLVIYLIKKIVGEEKGGAFEEGFMTVVYYAMRILPILGGVILAVLFIKLVVLK